MLKKLLVAMLALCLVACGGEKEDDTTTATDAKYTAGTYTAEAQGMNPIKVSVEVTADKIVAVEIVEHSETPGISDGAIENIPTAIVDAQSTEVEVFSGATVSSNAIIAAVNDALTQAAAK